MSREERELRDVERAMEEQLVAQHSQVRIPCGYMKCPARGVQTGCRGGLVDPTVLGR